MSPARSPARPPRAPDFPLAASVGAAVRRTHRAFAEDLQARLAVHAVNVGMWYFLRILWEEDGLTQRELARRIGVSEPTAAQQLARMARQGLIERRPSRADRRKLHVHLSAAGRALRRELLPYAVEVNAAALAGIGAREIAALRATLDKICANLATRQATRSQDGGRADSAPGVRPRRAKARPAAR